MPSYPTLCLPIPLYATARLKDELCLAGVYVRVFVKTGDTTDIDDPSVSAVLCCNVLLCCVVLCCDVLCCAVLCATVPCRALLHCTDLCCALLFYTLL